MKTCIIIPVYNHEQAIPHVLFSLKKYGMRCFLINDGSSAVCTQVLEDCARQGPDWIIPITRRRNGGKGAAVMDGFNAAMAQGYVHAIQIDADGQHDAGDIGKFLEASRLNPGAMILGKPVFDGTAPKSRLYGRVVTNLWIRINTLSFAIADGMCGFRLYPLDAVDRLCKAEKISQRMDFDIDIVVRLFWQGVDAVNIHTRVRYPLDGVSHFKMLRDNVMISKIHARLFFGMLARLPRLIIRHWR